MMTSSGSKRIFLCLLILGSFSTVLSAKVCDSDEYGCATTNNCIDSDYVCDGDNDCEDWSDEAAGLCSLGLDITPPHTTIQSSCSIEQFDCTGKCINRNWICDGDYDCDNGLDESPILCSQRTTTYTAVSPTLRSQSYTTTSSPCSIEQFDCIGKCINRNWVCDGDYDCDNGLDESSTLCSRRTTAYTWASPSQRSQIHTTTTAYIGFRNLPRMTTYQTVNSDPTATKSYYDNRMRDFSYQPVTSYATTPDYVWLRYSPIASTYQTVTPYPTTAEYQSTSNKEANHDTFTTSKNSLENCDPPAETGSMFSLLNWTECVIFAVALVAVIVIVTFICLKRRRHIADLNTRRGESQRQLVSYLNSSESPECQLVLVSKAVNVQSAVLQPNDHFLGQPPPYNTQPTTSQASANEPGIHNSSKGEYLV